MMIAKDIRASTDKIEAEYNQKLQHLYNSMAENKAIMDYKELKGEYDAAYLQALSLKILKDLCQVRSLAFKINREIIFILP